MGNLQALIGNAYFMIYTLEDERRKEPTNHPFRKEYDLNQTSMIMEPMLIFRGVLDKVGLAKVYLARMVVFFFLMADI